MTARPVPALIAVLAIGLVPVAAGDAPARTLAQTPFERAWDLQLPSPVHAAWWSNDLPELLFAQTTDGNPVYAIETMSGLTRWVTLPLPKGIEQPAGVSRTPFRSDGSGDAVNEDRIHLVSQERLFSIDGGSGHIVWSWLLPFSPSSGPMGTGRENSLRVFAGDWDGRIQAVTYDLDRSLPYVAWQWNLGAAVTGTPVVFQDLAYVGDHKGRISAYKMDRERLWSVDTGAAIHGSVLIRDRFLFAGNDDHMLVALNRLSGERRGHLVLDGAIRRAPFAFHGESERVYLWVEHEDPARTGLQAVRVQPDTVPFVVGDDRRLGPPEIDRTRPALEVVRMDREWFVQGFTTLIASTPEHLLVRRPGDERIHALNRRRGAVDWTWDPREDHGGDRARGVTVVPLQDPSDLLRSIFTIDEKGKVLAYRLQGYKPPEVKRAAADRAAEMAREKAKAERAQKAADAAAAGGDAPKP
jgi:hypothetical protein